MSYATMQCYRCGLEEDFEAWTEADAEDFAEEEGWYVSGTGFFDMCPECRDEDAEWMDY